MVGFLAMITVAAFWTVWHVIAGSVPAVEEIVWRTTGDGLVVRFTELPFAVSRWWDCLAAAPLAAWIAAAVQIPRPSRGKSLFFAGLITGLVGGPITWLIGVLSGALFEVFVGSIIGGVILVLIGGLVGGPFGSIFGLGLAAVFAPAYGVCVGIPYTLSVGFVVAMATATAFVIPLIAILGAYHTCRAIYEWAYRTLRGARRTEPDSAADPV